MHIPQEISQWDLKTHMHIQTFDGRPDFVWYSDLFPFLAQLFTPAQLGLSVWMTTSFTQLYKDQ